MTRRAWIWLSGLSAVAFSGALVLAEWRLKATGGPGIVCFELAGSVDRAAEIMTQWGDEGREAARLSLWLDFPFLIAYAGFLALSVSTVRTRGSATFARMGAVVVVFPIAAAMADVVEDIALLRVIDGHAATAPSIAAGFAWTKFVLLAVSVVYVLIGLIWWCVRHRAGKAKHSSRTS